jgi:ABC-2 type transport system permease protein
MRLFLHETRNQQRLFWRSREAAFFTFLLPIVLLLLLGFVYGDGTIDGVPAAPYLVAGMIGYGVVAVTFAGLAIALVIRRESGVLKRVRATPLPAGTYLGAVIASELVVVAIQVVIQILIGRYLLDAGFPEAPGSLVLALILGAASFAALGLAMTAAVKSREGSSAGVNAVYLPMTFICGVFFSKESLPGFLEAIADALPLTYLLQLVRDLFVGGNGWSGTAIAVISLWGAAGLAVALRAFRWEPQEG